MPNPKIIWSLLAATGLLGSVAVAHFSSWANSGSSIPLSPKAPRSERIQQLESLVKQAKSPQEQAQWRYILGATLQDAGNYGQALKILDGLQTQYAVLKEQILARQAQLLAANLQPSQQKWQEVSQLRGTLQPEALYQLGVQGDRNSWQQLLAQFPAHPRTAQVLSQVLSENPTNLDYFRQWITYFSDQPQSVRYAKQMETLTFLTPQDWELLGKLYYRNKEYDRARLAYGRATESAANLLQLANSYQALKRTDDAVATYELIINRYPQSPEAGRGQLQEAKSLPKEQRATFYQQVARSYPAVADQALWQAAKISTGGLQAQLYQQLATQFPKSEHAADATWDIAWTASQTGDTATARRWGERALTTLSADKYATPRLGFWAGRWADSVGDTQAAQTLYRTVLQRFPASYYGWRSAVHLGLDAREGSYNIRENPPVVVRLDRQAPASLPGGSPAVKELYRLGLAQEALTQLQLENYQQQDRSVVLRATEAVIRQQLGQSLIALKQLGALAFEDSQPMKTLHKERSFWEATYPTPYWNDLITWSTQNKVNPLLALSLMRQESAFEPAIKSSSGALGLMQLMPATAQDVARKLNLSDYSLTNPSDNMRLGTWYLAHTHDRWQDSSLLAVASYNAGPGNVSKWMKILPINDPELFVELIPFKETKGYVKSVFSNYWNYLRLYSTEFQQQVAPLSKGKILAAADTNNPPV